MGLRYVGGPWPTHRYRVYLDGVDVTERNHVMAADDREGYIVRVKTPSGGRYPIFLNKKGEIPYEVVHGDVRLVELPE